MRVLFYELVARLEHLAQVGTAPPCRSLGDEVLPGDDELRRRHYRLPSHLRASGTTTPSIPSARTRTTRAGLSAGFPRRRPEEVGEMGVDAHAHLF